MFADWLNFKSFLDESDISVSYIDEEGSEIPIESECEFQEAIRLAKVNKRGFQMILYHNKSKGKDAAMQNQCEPSNPTSLYLSARAPKDDKMFEDSFSKESFKHKCQCDENVPPEWFVQYMKKFKKELLHELKSNMYDIIHSALDKEKKIKLKGEIYDSLNKKGEAAMMSVGKKKKKGSEKDAGDLLDHREVKLAKKIEKLHPIKFDRLEKIDSKTRMLLEDKKRLLERKRHSKASKVTTNNGIVGGKELLGKSGSFQKNEACVISLPNAEFIVTLNFTNNGLLRWEAPRLECFDFNGLCPEEKQVSLPRLLPMESGCTTLKGKVRQSKGFLHFKCRLYDGLENLGPEFTCWAWVDGEESLNKLPNFAAVNSKGFEEMKSQDSVGLLMDFDKYEFTAMREKIEKNISDIERNLQDIDLLQPSVTAEDTLKKNEVNYKVIEELQSSSCDLQNLEKKGTDWKEKLELENPYFGLNCSNAAISSHKMQSELKDITTTANKLDSSCEKESNSDSELSIVFISEEDENFSIVPLPSNGSSPTESVDEEKFSTMCPKCRSNYSNASGKKGKSTEIEPSGLTPNGISLKVNEKVFNSSENRQLQLGFIKNRSSSGGEEVLVPKSRKIEPSSPKYVFTSDNMTPPTFIEVPEKSGEEPLKFTFTGEKEKKTNLSDRIFEEDLSENINSEKRKEQKWIPEGVFERRPWLENSTDNEEEKNSFSQDIHERQHSVSSHTENTEEKWQNEKAFNGNKIATTDASGKAIYAVHSSGCCLPIADLLKSKDYLRTSKPNF